MKTPTQDQIDAIKGVEISTSYDIRKAITAFMPRKVAEEAMISTQFEAVEGESGKKVMMNLTAPLGCDYYTQFMAGMNTLKTRVDAIAKHGENARKALMVDGHAWVDNIIKTRLGGKREGLRVRWDISEGIFFFDPFTGKLTKCESPTPSPTSSSMA